MKEEKMKLVLLDDIKKQIKDAILKKYKEMEGAEKSLNMEEIFSVIDKCDPVWPMVIAPNGVRNTEVFTVRAGREDDVVRDKDGNIMTWEDDNDEFWELEEDARVFVGLVKTDSEENAIKECSEAWRVPEEMVQAMTLIEVEDKI